MLEIPLNAKVECVDGHAGKSTHVIIDPRTKVVTHIVVKEDNFGAQDRLVPIDLINSTTPDLIRLNSTLNEIAKLPHFSEVRYVNYGFEDDENYATYAPDYVGMSGPYGIPTAPTAYVPLIDETVPQGERALMQGAKVEATDGNVGTVGDLIIDQESGQITHFTLQEGHFWGKKRVIVPLIAVDHAEEEVVYLKLDKHAISTLPSTPDKIKGGKHVNFEFIAKVFDAPNKAADALAFVKEFQHQQRGALKIHNSAILAKDAGGKLSVTETGNFSKKKGTMIGAIAGGLIGALAGPIGIVIGAAAGAGVGHTTTSWRDLSLPDEFMARLKESLQPNTSALIILVEHQYLKLLSDSMADIDGILLQYTLSDAVVEQLLKEQQA